MANYIVPVLSEYEWQKGVISIESTPPSNPANGDRYIVASSAVDIWLGHENEIVTYDNGIWTFMIPFNGIIVFIRNQKRLMQFNSVKWEGLVASGRDIVIPVNNGITLTIEQFGHTFTCNSSSSETFYLPSVDSSHIGAKFRFVKLGSGTLIVEAADSDRIADSGVGDTIYNDEPNQTYATLSLMLVAENQWSIIEGHGTWTTTD